MPKLRVAVIFGGKSGEHEVSIASAASIFKHLDPQRYDALPIKIEKDGRWMLAGEVPKAISAADVHQQIDGPSAPSPGVGLQPIDPTTALAAGSIDVVFPVLHGPFGEDGTVQGLLELAGVPYVGAGVLASALCMDKDVFKAVMRDHGIPVTENITLRLGDEPRNPFGFPVFVKPARLGSSVGITKAHNDAELAAAVDLAFRHDEKVLVEEFVS